MVSSSFPILVICFAASVTCVAANTMFYTFPTETYDVEETGESWTWTVGLEYVDYDTHNTPQPKHRFFDVSVNVSYSAWNGSVTGSGQLFRTPWFSDNLTDTVWIGNDDAPRWGYEMTGFDTNTLYFAFMYKDADGTLHNMPTSTQKYYSFGCMFLSRRQCQASKYCDMDDAEFYCVQRADANYTAQAQQPLPQDGSIDALVNTHKSFDLQAIFPNDPAVHGLVDVINLLYQDGSWTAKMYWNNIPVAEQKQIANDHVEGPCQDITNASVPDNANIEFALLLEYNLGLEHCVRHKGMKNVQFRLQTPSQMENNISYTIASFDFYAGCDSFLSESPSTLTCDDCVAVRLNKQDVCRWVPVLQQCMYGPTHNISDYEDYQLSEKCAPDSFIEGHLIYVAGGVIVGAIGVILVYVYRKQIAMKLRNEPSGLYEEI